jgi:tripartite-type tricarboxylate transporter receptor subunit TctC
MHITRLNCLTLPSLTRTLSMAAIALCLLGPTHSAFAQATDSADSFPNRAVNITVTFPPGGGTDILARLIGNALAETLGHAAVVENKPGASGNVGSKYVSERVPDGYSLLMVNSSFAINPAVFSAMPFDPKKDFAPIINVAFIPSVLAVPANSPYKNLAELLTAAKPAKNDVSYGSCGNGTPQHLAGESLNIEAKTNITHIPYGGCGPALKDVVGGQIEMAFSDMVPAVPQIRGNRLRALAVTTAERSPALPGVPTMSESGVRDELPTQWWGVIAPKGLPTGIVARLNSEIHRIVNLPEVKERYNDLGIMPLLSTPERMHDTVRIDGPKTAKVLAAIGLKPE